MDIITVNNLIHFITKFGLKRHYNKLTNNEHTVGTESSTSDHKWRDFKLALLLLF